MCSLVITTILAARISTRRTTRVHKAGLVLTRRIHLVPSQEQLSTRACRVRVGKRSPPLHCFLGLIPRPLYLVRRRQRSLARRSPIHVSSQADPPAATPRAGSGRGKKDKDAKDPQPPTLWLPHAAAVDGWMEKVRCNPQHIHRVQHYSHAEFQRNGFESQAECCL